MKRLRYLIAASLIGLIVTFAGGCFNLPTESVMPVWDVDLNIPVIDKTMKLSELLKPSENIAVSGEDGLYLLMINNIEKSVKIQGNLTIPFHWAPDDTLAIAGPGSQTIKGHLIYNPDPDYHIDTASFTAGAFNLKLKNSSPGRVHYKFTLPGFRSKSSGAVLTAEGDIEAGMAAQVTLPLVNCLYAELPIVNGSTDLNSYQYQGSEGFLFVAEVRSESPFVFVKFKTEVNSDEIGLDHIAGRLKKTVIPHSDQSFETSLGNDVENFADNIDLKEVSLKLNLKTLGSMRNIKISDRLAVTGYRKSSNGTLYSPVQLKFNSLPYHDATIIAGRDNLIEFNTSNSNLAQFLLNFPAVVTVGSDVVLESNSSEPDETQSISNRDEITASMDISSPMKLSIKNAEFTDTLRIELTQDQRDDIRNGNEAALGVEIENHIALGAIARATFTDRNYRPLFSVKSRINGADADYINIQPAFVDNDGNVAAPSVSNAMIVLTKDNIQAFDQAEYVIVKIALRSSGYNGGSDYSQYVNVSAKDFMRYKIFGRLNYHVDTEGEN